MLSEILKALLITSIAGTCLTAVITFAKPITKKVFSYAWHYYIWLAVLAVMLLPVRFTLPQKVDTLPVTVQQTVQNVQSVQTAQTAENTDTVIPIIQTEPKTDIWQMGTGFVKRIIDNRLNILAYLWLTGAIMLFLINLISYIRLIRKMLKESIVISCPETANFIKRKITVRVWENMSSPFMTGIFKPTLVLPAKELTEEQLNNILRHEMTHFKRHDILYKWFVTIVKCLHWFNPVVWYVSKQINTECEISCDMTVTLTMSKDEEMSYIDTILALLPKGKTKQIPLTTQMASSKMILRRRFEMIRNKRKTSKFVSALSAVIAVVLLGATVFASGAVNGYINNEEPVEVFIDGSRLTDTYENVPFWNDNTPYLPLRETCRIFIVDENIISWGFDNEYKTNYAELNIPQHFTSLEYTLNCRVYVNRNVAIINGNPHLLDEPVILKDNTTYVPYKFFELIVETQSDNGSSKLFDNLYVYDKSGSLIDKSGNNTAIRSVITDINNRIVFDSEELKNPEDTVNGFFKAFSDGNIAIMSNYCTESCINTFFGDGYVFGMTQATLTNMEVDFREYLKSSNDFIILVNVSMTPNEVSVYEEGQTEASFYVMLLRQPNGTYLIDQFATGL